MTRVLAWFSSVKAGRSTGISSSGENEICQRSFKSGILRGGGYGHLLPILLLARRRYPQLMCAWDDCGNKEFTGCVGHPPTRTIQKDLRAKRRLDSDASWRVRHGL